MSKLSKPIQKQKKPVLNPKGKRAKEQKKWEKEW